MKKHIGILGLGHVGKYVYDTLMTDDRFKIFGFDLQTGYDLSDPDVLHNIISGLDAVIVATPFFLNKEIALTCAIHSVAYFDLTESNEVSDYIKSFEDPKCPLVCQCGLAPGMVSVIANSLMKKLTTVDSVAIRVGALPAVPNNHMGYSLTWNTEGLINEYIHPCKAVVNGKLAYVQPLEDIEMVNLDGVLLEAANTSGGIGTLANSLENKVNSVTYKTLRYPNHWSYMKFLKDDLKLKDNFDNFVKIFNNSIPHTEKDRIYILIKVIGKTNKNNKLMEFSYEKIIKNDDVNTAIQISTGSGVMSVVDVWANGNLSSLKGLVKQEDLPSDLILESKYASCYNI